MDKHEVSTVGAPHPPVIGWREWVELPDLGIQSIKCKVDSGARSSSLHAFDLVQFERNGERWVRFKVHPTQRKGFPLVEAEAKILEMRSVRSSSGRATIRPVIVTRIGLLGMTWPVELTLANRDAMGFRMLLGREAFRGRFLVDAARSFLGIKPELPKKSSLPRKSSLSKKSSLPLTPKPQAQPQSKLNRTKARKKHPAPRAKQNRQKPDKGA